MEGNSGLRKGAWTEEEDNLLRKCVQQYGEGKWHRVPFRAGLNRCRKSCRLRWLNYLKPSIKRGVFSADEVDLMIRLHKLLGNRWSLIAGRLPGRTANDVKNYWNTSMRKSKTLAACEEAPKQALQITKANIIKPRPRIFKKTSSRFSSGETPTTTTDVPPAGNQSKPSEATLPPMVNKTVRHWESSLEDHNNITELNAIAAWGSENDKELFSSFFSEVTDQPTSCTAGSLVEETISCWSNCSVDVDLWNLLN